jgi:UDP-N-acetylenolpyruvoylglucosamine reductase
MNAGAHGSEMSMVLETVDAITSAGELKQFARSELPMSYRHSGLRSDIVVIGGTIRLRKVDPPQSIKKRAECLAYRKKTQTVDRAVFWLNLPQS